jgi:poly-gamma-glutamate synthesis protein (capsule biosynthesis protein)
MIRSPLIYSIYPFLIYSLLILPGEYGPPTTTLAFVGDVMLGRGVAQALDGDWEAAFAGVRPWLAEADLALANLESPLTDALPLSLSPPLGMLPLSLSSLLGMLPLPLSPPTGGDEEGYDLRAPLEAVAALRAAGFDVVSLANNHALDAGQAGLRETVDTLHAAGIAALVDGETGTLVGWDTGKLGNWSPVHQSTSLPVYRLLAFDDSAAPLDVGAAAGAVAEAAEEADLVIVSIHWGGEYQAAPSLRQQAIARRLSQAGAALIVGHGPHVLQRIEWVGGTLVAYSLGNFLFDQPYPADCRWGAILRITLRGERIVAVEALPTVAERGHVIPASPETAARIRTRLALNQSPFSILHPPSSNPNAQEHTP